MCPEVGRIGRGRGRRVGPVLGGSKRQKIGPKGAKIGSEEGSWGPKSPFWGSKMAKTRSKMGQNRIRGPKSAPGVQKTSKTSKVTQIFFANSKFSGALLRNPGSNLFRFFGFSRFSGLSPQFFEEVKKWHVQKLYEFFISEKFHTNFWSFNRIKNLRSSKFWTLGGSQGQNSALKWVKSIKIWPILGSNQTKFLPWSEVRTSQIFEFGWIRDRDFLTWFGPQAKKSQILAKLPLPKFVQNFLFLGNFVDFDNPFCRMDSQNLSKSGPFGPDFETEFCKNSAILSNPFPEDLSK